MQDDSFGVLSPAVCVVILAGSLTEPTAGRLRYALEAAGWDHGFGGADGMVMQRERNGCFDSSLVGSMTERSPTTAREDIGPANRMVLAFAMGEPLCEEGAP
jgi:hypothetical protein